MEESFTDRVLRLHSRRKWGGHVNWQVELFDYMEEHNCGRDDVTPEFRCRYDEITGQKKASKVPDFLLAAEKKEIGNDKTNDINSFTEAVRQEKKKGRIPDSIFPQIKNN